MKEFFPIFDQAGDLLYFDSAATTHKPQVVIDAVGDFYGKEYASVFRGVYDSASQATAKVENVREKVATFLGAKKREIVFTHSTTESINLLAYSLGQSLGQGDEVLVCVAEHHSNFLPWKEACKRQGATFVTFDVREDGTLDLDDFQQKLSSRTKIVAISHESNVLGIENPVAEITKLAHEAGALVVCDGAQVVVHKSVDVAALDVDFYAFSGHKLYGPTGVGVLFGKYDLLLQIPPFHFGGGMVEVVEDDLYRDPPYKFEAGTPMIASIVGLGAALDFIHSMGWKKIEEQEREVSNFLFDHLQDFVTFLTPLCRGSAILTFEMEGLHAADAGVLLSLEKVCVRVGNLCAQTLMERFEKKSVVRISLGIYNTLEDAKRLVKILSSLQQYA